jgi:hypothetical protein
LNGNSCHGRSAAMPSGRRTPSSRRQQSNGNRLGGASRVARHTFVWISVSAARRKR